MSTAKNKYRVCNMRVLCAPTPYQFPDRNEAARIIRKARAEGYRTNRVKCLGTLPGQPDGVDIYLAKNGVNTLITLASY